MSAIERSPDASTLAETAAARIAQAAQAAIAQRGRFVLSLAGGSTPKAAYSVLARLPQMDWTRVLLLFGDERCVPPDHAESNYRMVADALLSHLQAKPRVLRMAGEHSNPAQAAKDYEASLREVLGDNARADLALLGIGEDGHTASLFPGRQALFEQTAWCVDTLAPDNRTARLTLTVPFLRRSEAVWFLAAGDSKAHILPAVLQDRLDPERFPAQLLAQDPDLNVTVMLDEAAAVGLA